MNPGPRRPRRTRSFQLGLCPHEREALAQRATQADAASRPVAIRPDSGSGAFLAFTKPLITTEELASVLQVDPSTVRRWRTAKPLQGPPFITLSERVTVYSAEDVQAWLTARRVVPGGGR